MPQRHKDGKRDRTVNQRGTGRCSCDHRGGLRKFFTLVGGGPDDDGGEEQSVHSEEEDVVDTEDTEDDDEMELWAECLSASAAESEESEDESDRRDGCGFLSVSILVGRFAAAEAVVLLELEALLR